MDESWGGAPQGSKGMQRGMDTAPEEKTPGANSKPLDGCQGREARMPLNFTTYVGADSRGDGTSIAADEPRRLPLPGPRSPSPSGAFPPPAGRASQSGCGRRAKPSSLKPRRGFSRLWRRSPNRRWPPSDGSGGGRCFSCPSFRWLWAFPGLSLPHPALWPRLHSSVSSFLRLLFCLL